VHSKTFGKILPWVLVIGGLIGLAAAFIIMVEKIHLMEDPAFIPNCDLNPVISCGSVMKSDQSHAFGFPNPLIGLMAFPVVIATGLLLLTRTALKRWWMIGLQLGTIFGLAFVHWLFFQSTYRIGALCPYCIAVWIVTISAFWYTLLYNLQSGNIKVSARLIGISDFIQRHHLDILIFWFLVLFLLILKRFWYYYGPQLGF
jgi:uncharacterized membrane protein